MREKNDGDFGGLSFSSTVEVVTDRLRLQEWCIMENKGTEQTGTKDLLLVCIAECGAHLALAKRFLKVF